MRNPTVELPVPVEDVIEGIEGVVVTLYHPDHCDKAAGMALPMKIPVFCQPRDEVRLSAEGFQEVIAIEESL